MGRGALILAVGATASLLMAISAPAAGKSRSARGPPRAATLIAAQGARVYSLAGSDPPWTERIFGCLRSSQHPWQLSPQDVRQSPRLVAKTAALSRPWAGGLMVLLGVDTHRYTVRARNLRTGALTECEAGGGNAIFKSNTDVKKLVLTVGGAIAWSTERVQRGLNSSGKEILACGANGKQVLDAAEDIDLSSLEVHGTTLTWLDSGTRRRAEVP